MAWMLKKKDWHTEAIMIITLTMCFDYRDFLALVEVRHLCQSLAHPLLPQKCNHHSVLKAFIFILSYQKSVELR